jgi:putative hemolysin
MRMLWLTAAAVLLLAIISIALSCIEAAFYLIRRRHLGLLAHQNPRTELVVRYLDDPARLLMPIQMGTYMAHVMMTALMTAVLLNPLQHWALAVAILVMVIYLLLFRLTVPYALVRKNPERALFVLLPFFDAYARALAPVILVLRRRADPDTVPEGPAEPLTSEAPTAPVHESDEKKLEESLLRFSELLVRDVLTPRPDIVAIEATASVEDLRRVFRETKFSRLPVFGENLDDIVGVISVRDLMEYEGGPEGTVRPLMRPALLVPDPKKAADLLKDFQAKRMPFAVVIDEYGGTAGVVTVEDVVEELVGEIKDEYDIEAEPIVAESDGSLLVSGRVNVDRLEQTLEAPLANGEEVGTVGGLVTTLFGRIPRSGERIDHKGFRLEVVAAERKRVNRVRIRRLRPSSAGRTSASRRSSTAWSGRRSRSSPPSRRPRATASWPS